MLNTDLYTSKELETVIEDIMNGVVVRVYHYDNVRDLQQQIKCLFNEEVKVVDNIEDWEVMLVY